jgi:hypothetical protein
VLPDKANCPPLFLKNEVLLKVNVELVIFTALFARISADPVAEKVTDEKLLVDEFGFNSLLFKLMVLLLKVQG